MTTLANARAEYEEISARVDPLLDMIKAEGDQFDFMNLDVPGGTVDEKIESYKSLLDERAKAETTYKNLEYADRSAKELMRFAPEPEIQVVKQDQLARPSSMTDVVLKMVHENGGRFAEQNVPSDIMFRALFPDEATQHRGAVLPDDVITGRNYPNWMQVLGIMNRTTAGGTEGAFVVRDIGVSVGTVVTREQALAPTNPALTNASYEHPILGMMGNAEVPRPLFNDSARLNAVIGGQLEGGVGEGMGTAVLSNTAAGNNDIQGATNQIPTANTTTVASDSSTVPPVTHRFIYQVGLRVKTMQTAGGNPTAILMENAEFQVAVTGLRNQNYYIPGVSLTPEGVMRIWGVPVLVTDLLPNDTIIIGDFNAAELRMRENISMTTDPSTLRNLGQVLVQAYAEFGFALWNRTDPSRWWKFSGANNLKPDPKP